MNSWLKYDSFNILLGNLFQTLIMSMCKTSLAPGQLLRSVLMEKSYLCKAGYPVLYNLRACSHDPGTTHYPGQLTDPGVNFASMHGLTPVTVHMSFSLPRGNSERRVTRCTTPGNPPCRGNFSPCEQNAKVAPGQE